jgi:hypothetical protein
VKLLVLTVILASKTQFQTRKSAAPGNTALKIMQPGQAYMYTGLAACALYLCSSCSITQKVC